MIAALSEKTEVSIVSRLRAEMVFHGVCGDLAKGVVSARQLVFEHKARGHIGDVFLSLCNVSVSCRAAGLFEEAEASLLEALSIADEHRLAHSRPAALDMLANLALELGESDKARRWFHLLEAAPPPLGDFNAALNVRGIATRLALLDKRFALAKQLTASDLKEAYADQILHRKSYRLALIVAARLETGGKHFERAVKALEETHERSRVNPRQAFPTFVLYRGLQRLDQAQTATQMLKDYLTKYRREPWSPGNHLLDSLPA